MRTSAPRSLASAVWSGGKSSSRGWAHPIDCPLPKKPVTSRRTASGSSSGASMSSAPVAWSRRRLISGTLASVFVFRIGRCARRCRSLAPHLGNPAIELADPFVELGLAVGRQRVVPNHPQLDQVGPLAAVQLEVLLGRDEVRAGQTGESVLAGKIGAQAAEADPQV